MDRSCPAKRSRTRNIVLIAMCAAILVAGTGYLAFRLMDATFNPRETTDVNDYTTLMRQWAASGLVGHFPATIPPQAKNVRLSSFPGYLQQGGWIQLRMQLPADEIGQIEAQLRQATQRAYAGGGFFTHYNRDQKNNVPTTHFYTADDPAKTDEFPSHYTLYVLHAEDRAHGSWNNGNTCGTIVSSAANEVIYWADSW